LLGRDEELNINAAKVALDMVTSWISTPTTKVKIEEVKLKDLTLYWLTPDNCTTNDSVILYFHGGAFISGSLKGYKSFVSKLALQFHRRILFLEYRLAPEYTLPTIVHDAVVAYDYLVNIAKIKPKNIGVMGDSAGGGLTLLLLQNLRDNNLSQVGGAITLSAWTDLSASLPSVQRNRKTDPVVVDNMLKLGKVVVGEKAVAEDPTLIKKLSPLYNSFKNLPPLFMIYSTIERIADDTEFAIIQAKADGVDVVGKGNPHQLHVLHFIADVLASEVQSDLDLMTEFWNKNIINQ